jgi:NAD(P)-dependent dehydrogenase (short-subunit alcohol dehydrogenase family)
MVKASVSPGCFTTSPLAQESFRFVVDHSNVSAIERLFTLVKDRFHRLDVLVNNVAYTKKSSARPEVLTRSEDQTRDALLLMRCSRFIREGTAHLCLSFTVSVRTPPSLAADAGTTP